MTTVVNGTSQDVRQQSEYAAGIMPYAVYKGKVYILLGKDCRENLWSDFGGKAEPNDVDPLDTACREFYEETLGSVCDTHTMRSRLTVPDNYTLIESTTAKGNKYMMYCVRIPYAEYGIYFMKTFGFIRTIMNGKVQLNNEVGYKFYTEKIDLQWFIANDFKKRSLFRSVFYNTVTNNINTIKNLGLLS